MAIRTIFFYISLALVWIDGLLEMGLAESCLFWMMQGAAGPYHMNNPGGGSFIFNSEPAHVNLAVTRAASAAGAFAWTVMGIGGLAAVLLQRSRIRDNTWARTWWSYWPYMSILFTLYTLIVVIALNALVDMHEGQKIDPAVASKLGADVMYPLDSWTLPNFYSAVLNLGLVQDTAEEVATAKTVLAHRNTMYSWRWNLVPLILIQTAVCVLSWAESREWKRRGVNSGGKARRDEEAVVETKSSA